MEDQLLAGVDDLRGVHVMTIHNSKGKQVDAVIIVRERQRLAAGRDPASFSKNQSFLLANKTTETASRSKAFNNAKM